MTIKREKVTVADVGVELARGGTGRPMLFLHGGHGLERVEPFLDSMAEDCTLHAPTHPGFGHSDWPRNFRSVDDLAYLYMDLAEQLDLRDAVLVGSSFGGWIALEMMVRAAGRFSHLVLVDTLGLKFGDREARDILDMHATPTAELNRALYADPGFAERDLTVLSDEELTAIAQNREGFVWYGWKPYMHNPGLRKWLHRVSVPTLVAWGAADGIVTPDYGRQVANAIPGARFELIEGAGHYPHLEQPQALKQCILEFVGGGS